MSKKAKTKSPVDRATPVLRDPRKTAADMVAITRTKSQAMQASPEWAQAVEVQGSVKAWNVAADDLEASSHEVKAAREALSLAVGKERIKRRKWRAATRHVLSTVNVFADGSVDVVKGLSLDVQVRTAPATQSAPENLSVSPAAASGSVLAKWKRGTASHGFIAQYAMDPANPATYSGIVPVTGAQRSFGGLPPGSTVHVRVAAVDPTAASGQSPWTTWVAGSVR